MHIVFYPPYSRRRSTKRGIGVARYQFRLPDIGEGVTEGEVVAWHVKAGDRVVEDEPMVEVMTDKATVVIGAPKSGKVVELLADVGDVVKVGAVLVVIDTGNGARVAPGARASQMTAEMTADPQPEGMTRATAADPSPTQPASGERSEQRPSPEPAQSTAAGSAAGSASAQAGQAVAAQPRAGEGHAPVRQLRPSSSGERPAGGKVLATPATRKLAQELGVDLSLVEPSGPGRRVTKQDVLAYAERLKQGPAAGPEVAAPSPQASDLSDPSDQLDQRVPFVGMRRKIAERMQASKNTAAHFTFVEECEADALMALRERLRDQAEAQNIDLNYLPFVVKATVAALQAHPILNSTLDTETNELVIRNQYHIGIATATEEGLVVPVIRDADKLGLLEIAAEIDRLAAAARRNELAISELTGSTFTVTSLGKLSGLFATPVINLPNVGILSIHRIKQKPVVRDGQIAVGNIMLLSLSFDHRIVDGQTGAAFAYDVIHYLEDTSLLFAGR